MRVHVLNVSKTDRNMETCSAHWLVSSKPEISNRNYLRIACKCEFNFIHVYYLQMYYKSSFIGYFDVLDNSEHVLL